MKARHVLPGPRVPRHLTSSLSHFKSPVRLLATPDLRHPLSPARVPIASPPPRGRRSRPLLTGRHPGAQRRFPRTGRSSDPCRGSSRSALRATPSPEVTELVCRLPLPTLSCETRGCSPWRPAAVSGTASHKPARDPLARVPGMPGRQVFMGFRASAGRVYRRSHADRRALPTQGPSLWASHFGGPPRR